MAQFLAGSSSLKLIYLSVASLIPSFLSVINVFIIVSSALVAIVLITVFMQFRLVFECGRRLDWFRTQALQASLRNINWSEFETWVKGKYAKTYSVVILAYARKHHNIMFSDNLRELDSLPQSIRNNCIKSLTILSKFLGKHEEFHNRLKDYGIKLNGDSGINAFIRILNNNNNTDNNVIQWLKEVKSILRENENLLLEFLLKTGIRKDEAFLSFNLMVDLAKQNRLLEYYDESLNCLMHFRYPKLFLRHTKNVYLSFIPQSLLNRIANSEPVTYPAIRKRLSKKGLHLRLNECRDYFSTLMLNNGFNELEVNLMQGRISGILFRHYFSPKLREMADRVFKVLETLTV
jgi:hypothetical protein